MASAITTVISYAVSYFGVSGAVAQAAQILIAVATSVAISRLTADKLSGDGPRFSKDATVTDTVFPHSFAYGEAAVGGQIFYSNVKTVHDVGAYIYIGVTHSSHLVEDITGVYFDETLLTSEIDWGTSAVTSGKYAPAGGPLAASVNLWKELGTTTQGAFSALTSNFGGDWTSAHQGKGRAHVLYSFLYQTASGELFRSGPPRSIRALVKGHLVYDPRLDSTQTIGSGTHRTNDPTTWEWSDNPILCTADYMTRYMNSVSFARMDWVVIAANADRCDGTVDIPGGGTQKRFTCNGFGTLADTHGDNIAKLLSSCLGYRVKVNGKWRLYAGGYQTPDVALTTADVAGEVVMQSAFPSRQRYNRVGSVYVSEDHGHYETDSISTTDASYLARDNGREIREDLKLPYTNNEYQAQRIQFYHLHQGNQQKQVTVPLRWTGLRVAPGGGITLTYPKYNFSNKPFRCTKWEFTGGSAPFVVTLREDSASAWDDPEVGDYSTKNDQGVVTLAEPEAIQPQNVTAIGITGAVKVSWSTVQGVDYVRVYASITSDWIDATLVYQGNSTSFTHALSVSAVRYYWVVGVVNNQEGTRNPDSDTSTITAEAGSGGPTANIMPFGYSDFETVAVADFNHLDSFGSVFTLDDTLAYLGTRSMKIVCPGTAMAGGDKVYFSRSQAKMFVRVPPGRRYMMVAWFYGDNADALNVNIQWSLGGAGGSAVSSVFNIPSSGAWVQLRVECDATGDSQTGYLPILNYEHPATPSGSPTFHVDALMLLDVTDYPEILENV